MANHLPTEEQKKGLRFNKWEMNAQELGTAQSWQKDDDEIVFVPDAPPAAYGYGALLMLAHLGIVPAEVEIEGKVQGAFIGDYPVPKVFNGKRIRIRYEVISD